MTSLDRHWARRIDGWVLEDPNGDLIAQISPAMRRQLLREGAIRSLLALILPIPTMFFLDRAILPLLMASHRPWAWHAYATLAGLLAIITIVGWRKSVREPLDRELVYRRKHGQWRWER